MRRIATAAFAFVLIAHFHVAFAGEPFVKTADIPYLGDAATDDYAKGQCRLDVFRPVDKKDYATIVWFHGGGLRGGSRDSGSDIARRMTANGIGVVLVSYRFSPKVKCPTYIEDAAASVAWTIRHIAEYDGDPKKVFVSGHSAGGYLTFMIGLDNKYLGRHGLSPADLAGCMPVAGQTVTHSTIRAERGMSEKQPLIDEFAPCYYAKKDTPPFILFAAEHDMAMRVEENVYFNSVMKAMGNKHCELHVIKDRTHGSVGTSFAKPDDETTRLMLKFIADVTAGK